MKLRKQIKNRVVAGGGVGGGGFFLRAGGGLFFSRRFRFLMRLLIQRRLIIGFLREDTMIAESLARFGMGMMSSLLVRVMILFI